MKSLGKHWFLVLVVLLIGWAFSPSAQAQKLWSEVRMNKSQVYVGEPVEVTVSVFTSTWFTAGVDPGNIKVEGAYTVFFRNVSTSKTVNGATVSGVDMIFNVFPSGAKDIVFPELQIEVESPADGDFKGRKHVIKTKPHTVKVRPIPPGFEPELWLVSNSVSVRQHWDGNLKNVKVGDVITRTVTRDVANTVSQLIPAVAWDSVSGVSEYPARSNVESHRSKTAISATRTESIRYLFEKEGEVIIPEMEFTWWNAYHKKLYKRTLPEVKITVQPNPDLGMLASIRDSLEAQIAATEAVVDEEEKPFTILGMSVQRFVMVSLITIFLLILMIVLLKRGLKYRKQYLENYHNSERYYWKQFARSAKGKDTKLMIEKLYQWLDQLALPQSTATHFAKHFGSLELQNEVSDLEEALGNSKITVIIDVQKWKEARRVYLHSAKQAYENRTWINP